MLDLENLPDRGPTAPVPTGKATGNTGLDFLPDSYEDKLRGLYRQDTSLPDAYAKNKKLSVTTGVPVTDTVKNPFTAEMQANEPDWKNISTRSPKTAQAMSENVDLFHMGKDDSDNLSWWESGLKKAGAAVKYLVSAPDSKRGLVKDMIPAAERGFRGVAKGYNDMSAAQALQALSTLSKIESGQLKTTAEVLRDSDQGAVLVSALQDRRQIEQFKKLYQKQLGESVVASLSQAKALRNKELAASPELSRFQAADSFLQGLSVAASNPAIIPELMSESLGAMAPSLPVIAVSGGVGGAVGLATAAGLSSMLTEYTSSFSEVFQELKIDLNDIEAARAAVNSPEFRQRMGAKLAKSGVIGAFDAATAGLASKMLAPKQILGKALTPGQRAGTNLAAQATIQATGGGAGEALGSVVAGEEIKPGAVLAEMVAEIPGSVVDVFTMNVAEATRGGMAVQDAISSADRLAEMMKRATESKLRTRAPETFAQFVQELADSDGDSLSTVYIDAETLNDVLQQANIPEGELLGQLPSLLPQYQDALNTKSTVAIPIGELLTNVAGTDLEPLLLPHLRDSDDVNSLSRAEAETASKKAQEYLQQMAQFVVQESVNAEATRASAEAVRTKILEQFTTANRFTADVNESYSNAARDFYTVLANDLKITPEQLWEGGWTDANGNVQAPFQLQIRAEGTEGPTLNQPGELNKALQDRVDTDYTGVVAEYNALPETKGGQVINTDIARELSPEYRGDRSRAAEVHDAASNFTKRLYADKLAAPVAPGKAPVVVFTAGGTGAGKSSVAAVTGPMMDTADIVYDTTMSTFKSGDEKIQQALASGRSVTIAYVYRDPVEALTGGALPRAMDSGRTAPLDVLQKSHTGARKVIDQLAAKYAGDERVTIIAIDNSRGRGNAAVVALDQIPQINDTGLGEKLNEALENAYATGTISEQVYRGTVPQGVERQAGRRDDARPEQRGQRPGDGAGRQESGTLAPLEGAPRVAGATGPDPSLVAVAEQYAAENGISLQRQAEYVQVDPERAARIAQAYEEMQHSPQDPAVQEAYAELIKQTTAQYRALEAAGYTFWFYDQNNDPYQGNPWNAMRDLRENKSMAVFATDAGYGSELTPSDIEGDPMLADTGLTWPVGSPTGERKPVLANDLFRAVHDAFGHGLEGAGFRAQGEENAWQAHVRLFTGSAVAAITTETRGQNSWLNYGPYGAVNQNAKVEDTVFAEQKTGLMPEWTWTEGRAGNAPYDRAGMTEQNALREAVDAALDAKPAATGEGVFEQATKKAVTEASPVELPQELTATTAIDIRNGKPLTGKQGMSVVQVGEYFDSITGVRDYGDPVEFNRALDTLVGELQYQMQQEKNGLDWYEEDIGAAFAETQKLIPELESPAQRQLFSVMAGILSPQTNARDNWFIAAQAFRSYKDTGTVPGRNPVTGSLWQGGTTSVNKEKALNFLNNMVQDLGEAETIEWLFTEHTVKDLNAARKKWGNMGPGVDGKAADTALGLRAFGPKVGPFVMNINGIHEITVDMWATRTFNRLFGRMIGPDGKIVDAPTEAQRKIIKELFNAAAERVNIKGYQAQSVAWFFEQQLFNQLGTGAQSFGFSDGARRFTGEGADNAGAVAGGQVSGGYAQAATSVTGYHFSNQKRTSLSGSFYGTGLKGQERDRLARATDSRIRDRVYFYVDEGKGVTPEQGVGGIAHSAELSNLYDVMADPMRLWDRDHNASESRILDAGFDGYYARGVFGTQGVAVVLGDASRGVEVQALDKAPKRATGASAAPQAPFRYGLMPNEIDAINASLDAVRAAAPSAAVRSGNLVMDRAELEAARPVLAGLGVQLPGGTLEQPARGTFSPSQLRIDVLKDADLSTVIHEMGHFFLEGMARFAALPSAPARVAEDLDKAFLWFKLPGDTPAARLQHWNGLTLDERRPYHEKWAESFEQYMFEGQPPTPELRPLFQRFREFLIAAYESLDRFVKTYGDQLTDEVRGVFGRMLATKAEIEAAERTVGYEPLYATKPEGMTDAEWADYQAQTASGTQTAIDQMQARSLRDLKWTVNARSRILKQLQRDVETKRKAMREEVTTEVRAMPVYAVQRFLKFGELEGQKVEGGKLSMPILKELYGEEPAALWRYLSTNMVTADAETGLHPNMVAELFGFKNGDEMVRAVVAADKEADMIDGLTDQRLLERYGDLVTERGINEAADRAIHNEARARSVATEMRFAEEALGRSEKTERGGYVNVALRAAKEFAAAMVARRRVRDLRPGQHTAAERRAAKKAMDAQKKGDQLGVVTAKRDQLLNHYASRATTDALAEIERKVDYLRKFEKDSVRKNLPADYLAQIDALLERFDLRRGTTLKALERRAALRDWVENQREIGNNPVIPDELLDEAYRTSYKEMTVEEFRALVDTVRNIEHLGKLKDKLLTLQDQRAFAAVVQEIELSIRENATKETPVRIDAPTKLQKGADMLRGFFSSHRKLSSLIRQMDGFKEGGVFWNVFVRSMNRAGDMEAVMRQEATQKLAAIFEPLLKAGKMRQQANIPAINASLSLETRLVIALNWGNDANQQRVMDGDNWSRQQVEAILGTLTPEQLGFVQQAWDLIDGYWPSIKAKEERVSGVAPEKVDPVPFEITAADGSVVEMRGGYYPIKYDPDRSSKAEADTEAEVTKQMMQGQYTRATTRRGHTKARADTVNRAVRKDINVMFEHINQVIHDLSWHEWLIDATRLLRAEPIDAAIRETAGPVILRELKKAIADIAAGEVPAQTEIERGLNYLRNGVTVIGMGWNLMTSLMQPLGLTQSIVRIGPKWVGKGMARWIGGAVKMEGVVADVYAKSDFMRLRGDTMQREINEIRNKVAGAKFTALQESYFYLIQKGQMIADLPTWLGMYERVMEETDGDEGMAISLADQAVRDAQGAGQVADLARIQRGGPLLKLFTNFYSYFNTTFNLTAERYNATNFKNPLQVGRFAVDMLMLYVVPTVLAFALKEAVKGSDDEEELLKKLGKEQLSYLLGTMVGLREIGASITGFNGYQGPAGTRFFSEVGKLAKQVEQGDVDLALIKAMNNTAGILLHYPAGAVNRAVEGFIALQEGKTDNPLVLLTGPKKE